MEFDFKKTMQESSTEELIEITTTKRDAYQNEAIIAAEDELKKRNYSSEELDKYIDKAMQSKEIEDKKSSMPLDAHYKILAFIFPGIIVLILSGLFKSDGYDKKSADLVKWTFYGLGFYILAVILLSVV